MILSDQDILREIKSGRLSVTPFKKENIQPSSIDLLLGYEFRIFKNIHKPYIDLREPVVDYMEKFVIKKDEPLIIHPGEFILGTSIETVKIPDNLLARLDGKSSLGRLGLIVHATAGFIDPGFEGQITYEITNLSNIPIAVYGGIKIAQLSIHMLLNPAAIPYGSTSLNSKYKGQKGPTASKMYLNFSKEPVKADANKRRKKKA